MASMNRTGKLLKGTVKRHPDGFGFLVPDDPNEEDVYVPRHSMAGVMSNDRVEVRVQKEPGGSRFRGEVVAVLERAVKRVMGQFLQHRPGHGTLVDKSFSWGADLSVEIPRELGIKDRDWVAAEILTYPGSDKGFTGRAVARIGDMENPQNDSLRMLHAHSIPFEFSKKTLSEADRLPAEIGKKDFKDRKDLTDLKLITIDGATAKDFDDAVYVERTREGFRLVVAIADVSHYVKPGSALDEDAYERGNSTYFPNFVAPMLPENLSNGLCSLKPNVYRAAFVADMQLDFQGQLTASSFYEALIESKARVTYGEAQEVIDGTVAQKLTHVKEEILRAKDLAKILMAKRFHEGSLDLDLPETEIELDEAGFPVDILQSERLFAHRLIEELMLMANVAVARFFKERGAVSLYRIHEEPKGEAIENLQNYLNAFGYNQNLKSGGLQKRLSRALEYFQGHAKETIVSTLVLRSLAQAKYSAQDVGHFGLAFPDYCHFTSPIRRYADLVVHRQMKALLYPQAGYSLLGEARLETIGVMVSACEQRSVKAERQVKAIKKARFMAKFVGEVFEGVITSVAKFGVFVQLRQFDVDGLVKLEMLGPGRYEFDQEHLRLVERRTKEAIELGQLMKVQVMRVDIEAGQVDFMPVGFKTVDPAPRDEHSQPKGKDLFKTRKYGNKSSEKNQSNKKHRKGPKDRDGVRKKRVSRSRK
jgi:ribonuclease R